MPEKIERVLIVGGGFAGVTLAQGLEAALPAAFEIVVLSASNHLVFTPMLPEVAARTISPLDVVVAGRTLTRRTRWLEAGVNRIDREKEEAHYVRTDGTAASMPYSHLVLACGATTDLTAIPGLAARGHALRTVNDAIDLGDDVIANFELAASETDAAMRRRYLTVVVIGGGFSGVEVAGHLADLMRAIRRFYPELKDTAHRLVLLHEGERLLPELHQASLSAFAARKLRENDIEVRLRTEANKVTSAAVQLGSGERIETGLVVCTVGTATHPLIRSLGLALEKGRLKTEPDMRVQGAAHLWALGDCSLVPNAYNGQLSPATAQFAVQQATHLAKNLGRVARGRPTTPFAYRPRGMLAAIGHHNAVAEIYGVKLSGFLAWFLWRGIYLMKLPTLSRKMAVALGWASAIPFPPNIVQLRREPKSSSHPAA